ncbi:hypothetical protein BCY91_13005 [Pelobium manganitolerans]|uniref:YetF C-terminal domain-containing protein n=1 Tax=Pelobium manganitolerans TaxID=1842495 RepID=A0A419SAN9_9SPHI|nr:YetF domain-containing protein [Pelobium manganitolerans]RKD19517.1 hypothetical protein BCY91_13005 [Pelobium manganitolerans]
METLHAIFGVGKHLTVGNMCARSFVVFFLALLLLRVSGRRSFGLKTPLDLIISILLGSILSRGVVGASPFVPVIVSCLLIVLLHRLFAWVTVHHTWLRNITEGKEILLYKNRKFIDRNLDKALVNKDDVLPTVRKYLSSDDLEKVDKVYMERNGEITVTKISGKEQNLSDPHWDAETQMKNPEKG